MEPLRGNAPKEDEAPAETPAAPPTAKPKVKLKRGRRADPNRAPPGYMRRLVDELGAEMLARQEARKAARLADPDYSAPPFFAPRPCMRNAEVFAQMLLTPAQKAYRRSKVLKAEREAKATRDAALLDFVRERKAEREAAAKRAPAERKERGVKLSYKEWRREIGGK